MATTPANDAAIGTLDSAGKLITTDTDTDLSEGTFRSTYRDRGFSFPHYLPTPTDDGTVSLDSADIIRSGGDLNE
jgi:hypothetical protein